MHRFIRLLANKQRDLEIGKTDDCSIGTEDEEDKDGEEDTLLDSFINEDKRQRKSFVNRRKVKIRFLLQLDYVKNNIINEREKHKVIVSTNFVELITVLFYFFFIFIVLVLCEYTVL